MSNIIDIMNSLEQELATKVNHSLNYSSQPSVYRGEWFPESLVDNPVVCLTLAETTLNYDISAGGMNYFNVDIYGYVNGNDEYHKNAHVVLALDIVYFLTNVYTYRDDFMGVVDDRIRLLDGSNDTNAEFLFRAKFKYDFDNTTIRVKE